MISSADWDRGGEPSPSRRQPQVCIRLYLPSVPFHTHTHKYTPRHTRLLVYSLSRSFLHLPTRSLAQTHIRKAHTRWLPDENSSSASHVATDREGCLWDRKVSPRRSVRREREDRGVIERKRRSERSARRRRYWIGDTAWGRRDRRCSSSTCPKAFDARLFLVVYRSPSVLCDWFSW